jgi:hypothetical protein
MLDCLPLAAEGCHETCSLNAKIPKLTATEIVYMMAKSFS